MVKCTQYSKIPMMLHIALTSLMQQKHSKKNWIIQHWFNQLNINPIKPYSRTSRHKKQVRENTLTGSESSLIEGPMAPSLDRSCRNLEGQFDLRVVISHKLLYSQNSQNTAWKKIYIYLKNKKIQFDFLIIIIIILIIRLRTNTKLQTVIRVNGIEKHEKMIKKKTKSAIE